MKALLEQVRQINTLGRAWRVICENGRSSRSITTRREIEEFSFDAESRLTKIQRQLNSGAFVFEPAKGVAIPKKGKNGIRPLVIAPIESRIVQRAVHDVLFRVPSIRRYADNPFSFGGVKKREGGALAAVPGAIRVVVDSIDNGATYIIRSDISAFFTRIPKSTVTAIVRDATNEPEFIELFSRAITVELENLASLRDRIWAFPIHEIGVAQGNSLSPLLGNLLLYDFDREMNSGSCCCIRYIDDFIILAPDRKTAENQFTCGVKLLAKHGLEVSADKTFRGDVARGFAFLGIELANGAIRPSRESRQRWLANVRNVLDDSMRAFRSHKKSGTMDRSFSLLRTLSEVGGMASAWGAHYSFCNEKNVFSQLDGELDILLRQYLGCYSATIRGAVSKDRRRLLGIPLLEELASRPFQWGKRGPVAQISPTIPAESISPGVSHQA